MQHYRLRDQYYRFFHLTLLPTSATNPSYYLPRPATFITFCDGGGVFFIACCLAISWCGALLGLPLGAFAFERGSPIDKSPVKVMCGAGCRD